ncbi:MAG TPA: hypothetical protein VEB00_07505 [Clostridia bacterium]|nr:hypothetical protein [Clostridia bacterium]
MIKYVYGNGFHFAGKFNELIAQLSAIENKQITLREYIQLYRQKLN